MMLRMWLLAGLMSSSILLGQTTTQPAQTTAALEVRATEAFNRGQYALALPMLRKLATAYQDRADKVGPIAEEIRVCEKNIANPPPDPAAMVTGGVVPNDPPMSAEKRVPHPVPKSGEVVDLAIKELGNFEFDAEHGGNIPADVKRMTGATIRLHGYMIP